LFVELPPFLDLFGRLHFDSCKSHQVTAVLSTSSTLSIELLNRHRNFTSENQHEIECIARDHHHHQQRTFFFLNERH
jgi:hypothetical protein